MKRLLGLGLSFLALAGTTTLARSAHAYDEDSAAVRANTGFKLGIGPVILFSQKTDSIGGGLDVDGRYGFQADPTILAPGARAAGYYIDKRFIGILMPTFRVTFPLGPFAPFLRGGVGGGFISNPSEGGVALLGGVGFMIHFGDVLGLGAEATYQTITSTDFQVFGIGPLISIAF